MVRKDEVATIFAKNIVEDEEYVFSGSGPPVHDKTGWFTYLTFEPPCRLGLIRCFNISEICKFSNYCSK